MGELVVLAVGAVVVGGLAVLALAQRREILSLRGQATGLEESEATARELAELRRQLRAAQDEIEASKPAEPVIERQLWLQAIGEEVAGTLGLSRIDIWRHLDEGGFSPFGETDPESTPPELDEVRAALRSHRWLEGPERAVIPIAGLTGELVGTLSLEGGHGHFDPSERRLVSDFARHIGSVLEIQNTREQLTEIESRREATRESLRRQGHGILKICPRCDQCLDESFERCPLDGAILLSSRRALPYRLGTRYRLVRVLARGAVGLIFVARDEQLERDVAVKFLNLKHFESLEARLRFQKETRAVARIKHRGVVTLFDSGELPDGSPFLIMELLDGADLGRVLAACGPGRPEQVARLIRQGAAALTAAHEENLIHRDIKPQNIFLAWRPYGFRVKILDFGLAQDLESQVQPQTGQVVGTPLYMSPEQIQERPLDGRSDLFSFASVCYQALTGQRTVQATDTVDLFQEILSIPPEPVSVHLPTATPEIDEAFAAALQKNPAERPANLMDWARTAALTQGIESWARGWSLEQAKSPVVRRMARGSDLPPTEAG